MGRQVDAGRAFGSVATPLDAACTPQKIDRQSIRSTWAPADPGLLLAGSRPTANRYAERAA